MPKITTFLWFNDQADDAASFYTSVFKKNSKVGEITRWGDSGPPGSKGSVLTVEFELDGQEYVAMNGGPVVTFNDAISLQIDCETQEEVDYYWEHLAEGGEKRVCGWLKDRYGLSWQVTPKILPKMLKDKDPARADRVMTAMMGMAKLDIEGLKRAYDGLQA
jgi:predicted 3-demethylubiquinone-9 3-methyltransferase (glyoxalase superfamily)